MTRNARRRSLLCEYASVHCYSTSWLIEIDLNTGIGNPITQLGSLDVRGLAFSADDELFAISNPNLPIYELFKLDVQTGQHTLVGSSGSSPIQGLDFALKRYALWLGFRGWVGYY